MDRYESVRAEVTSNPRRWLVTGAAGFIGSHCVQELLNLGQHVVALDSFATGHRYNLDDIRQTVGDEAWGRMTFVEGDIRDAALCAKAVDGIDVVLHQAALGSVPRSIDKPEDTHTTNVDGFVNVALASSRAGVKAFVYASSSSVYGDEPTLPKIEDRLGRPLSPYASSKRINEVYAQSFAECYDLHAVGLRYFNVVGARQDPNGAYAAVIPKWLSLLRDGTPAVIFGDGETSRDFCPVLNVVHANLLAAFSGEAARGQSYNVALGGRTTLNELYGLLRDGMAERGAPCGDLEVRYEDFRRGDIRHSHADISAASRDLGYVPAVSLAEGLAGTMDWYLAPGNG